LRLPRWMVRRVDALEACEAGVASTVGNAKTRARLHALVASIPEQPLTPERIADLVAAARVDFSAVADRERADALAKLRRLSGEPEPADHTTVDEYAAAFEGWLTGTVAGNVDA